MTYNDSSSLGSCFYKTPVTVTPPSCFIGKQLALLHTNSAVRTCGFDFSGNIIMFSTDKQMGYQCYLNFFDLRDPQQIGKCHMPLLLLRGQLNDWLWSYLLDLTHPALLSIYYGYICSLNVVYTNLTSHITWHEVMIKHLAFKCSYVLEKGQIHMWWLQIISRSHCTNNSPCVYLFSYTV